MPYFAVMTIAVMLSAFAGGAFAYKGEIAPDSAVSAVNGIDADSAEHERAAAPESAEQADTGADDADTADDAGIASGGANDSPAQPEREREAYEDSLIQVRRERAAAYHPANPDSAAPYKPAAMNRSEMFRSDGADIAEAMRYRSPTSIYVPFTLSSGMNRLMHYGNVIHTHPVSSTSPSMPFHYWPKRFYGSGMVSAAQASDLSIDMYNGLLYRPYPDAMAAPEVSILWENGAFDQNTLNLRIGRPLSQNLMMSVFSNYRYFAGTRFNHERNDVVGLYEFFNSDTASIMNKGYNPLTDEHVMGAALAWTGADSSGLYAAFTYAGQKNEYALDSTAKSTDRLNWTLIERGVYRVDAALLNRKMGPLRTNLKAVFVNETAATPYTTPAEEPGGSPSPGAPDTVRGGANNLIIGADAALPSGIGIGISGIVKNAVFFDDTEEIYSQCDPEVFYRREFPIGSAVNANINASAGAALFPWDDTVYYSPRLKASVGLSGGRASVSLFAALDGITVYPEYDTALYYIYRPWTDQYGRFGAEGAVRTKHLGATLGYQLTAGIDTFTVKTLWPQGRPPYPQPTHTIIVSPWISSIYGFSILSRTIITDTKPYIKTSAALSHLIRPRGMEYNFETELGYDYWSERAPVFFAWYRDEWCEPIHDLNLKITAHIRTFRLFYKVDNLLNLKQAYVPGYFSPGLTFRWGFNWILM